MSSYPESFDQAKLKAYIQRKPAAQSPSLLEVSRPDQIPVSLQCSLCHNICRKGMRLSCDMTGVCWGCAGKEITRGHVCWHCGEKKITSESHLVKDQVLRSNVKQFNTGKREQTNEQELRNFLIKPEIKNRYEVKSESVSPERELASSEHRRAGTVRILNMMPDDPCIAMFSEDGVWYNGLVTEVYGDGSALVYFTDYGNSERVGQANLVRSPEDLLFEDVLDVNVKINRSLRCHKTAGKLSFLPLAFFGEVNHVTLTAKQTMLINDLKGPVGVTMLADDSMAVVCRGGNCVSRFSKDGQFIGVINPGRQFFKPSDILELSNGEMVVRDEFGIQLFGANLEFVMFLAEDMIDRCFGLAEDDEGKIITINCNTLVGGNIKLTQPGQTDVFFIDRGSNKIVKRVEMVDLINQAVDQLQNLQVVTSAFRFLSYHNMMLYVVDMGLSCVFVLNKDGTESEMFGSRGIKEGEFRDPAGLVVDDMRTMMVVDSKNHRLQLINTNMINVGLVKVDIPLARPSGIFLDRRKREILVSNYLGMSVARYRLEDIK